MAESDRPMRNNFFLLFFLSGLAACSNAGVDAGTENSSGALYYDYQLWSEEESGTATIRLQYKQGSEEGPAVPLPERQRVLLDTTPFQPDSTKFLGTYYELTKPLKDFSGTHTVTIVDENGTAHRANFSFTPFELAQELPDELPQKTFTLHLKNLPASPVQIRLVMIDTSMTSPGINEELTVENGRLTVSQEMLSKLASGPVTMEISREEVRQIGSGTKSKGTFLLNYGIRRQFTLAE